MNIDIDPTDAALVVDVLISARRIQANVMQLLHATEAEKDLAALKVGAIDRHIVAIKTALTVVPDGR